MTPVVPEQVTFREINWVIFVGCSMSNAFNALFPMYTLCLVSCPFIFRVLTRKLV